MTPNPKIERLRYRQMQVRRLFARLRSECRSRSAIGSGGAQTHQTAAADRKDGARASAARSERHGATYLNAADTGVPAGTLHAIAARVATETLTAAIPVTGPEGNSRTARSAADADIRPKDGDE